MTEPISSEDARLRLAALFPHAQSVGVTADPFGGLRLYVVDDQFINVPPADRRKLVLAQISDSQIAYLQLLTLEEAKLLGEDEQPALDQLPLWPEALAVGEAQQRRTVHYPSRSFVYLPAPVVATFYSLRGGVGRSTALAHTARILARQDLSVLCIDMDLEAPGLASLFSVEEHVRPGLGVVPLLLRTEIDGTAPDYSDELIRIDEESELYLLPAGTPSADYARQLTLIDPSA